MKELFSNPLDNDKKKLNKEEKEEKEDKEEKVKYLLNKRTIFSLGNKNVNYVKAIFGFLIYTFIFIVAIPYYLIKNKYYIILSGYFPNVDLIATVLSYHGGPFGNIWRHLYNPSDVTMIGYIFSNIINYFVLLGVTFIVSFYTLKYKDIFDGWSRAFIMLIMTYLLPGNFVVYYMNKFGDTLLNLGMSDNFLHYLITVIFGGAIAFIFIYTEGFLIKNLNFRISKNIKNIKNIFN